LSSAVIYTQYILLCSMGERKVPFFKFACE